MVVGELRLWGWQQLLTDCLRILLTWAQAGAVGLRERLATTPADGLGVQEVAEVALMMSELRPRGARYSELGRAPLARND